MLLKTLATVAVGLPALLLGSSAIKTRHLARRAEKAVPPIGQFCHLDEATIHYVDIGSRTAPTLVLIHGLSGQLQHFTYALTDLLASDFRLIILDRPGCGHSEWRGDHRATLPQQSRLIRQFLKELDIQDAVLVGHSLGGAIALAMAMDDPDTARGLALLAPLTHPTGAEADVFKGLIVHSCAMRQLMAHTVAIPAAQRTADAALQQVFHPQSCPDDFLIRAGGILGLRPKAFVTASAEATSVATHIAQQAPRYAKDLTCRGGVLFGADDTLLAPHEQAAPMTAYGFECQIAPGKGHMLPITDPELCNSFIRRTIARL